MKIEIREAEGRLHISGYVNVVERDSKPIETLRGRCVEQVRAGAFAASLSDGHEVRMMLNHNRNIGSTTNGTLTLKENNVGLYAEAWTDDSEVRELARRGELKGWSFGFKAIEDRLEERSGDIPRRYLDRLELHEVSVLSVNPAYSGTLIEARSEPVETLESNAEDTDTEDKSSDETRSDGTAADQSAEDEAELEFRAQKTAELKAFVDEYRRQKTLELYCYLKTLEFRDYMRELRYNHYHNPQNGQFASGAGGGVGLYYSMGKGKGAIVGASSAWSAPKNSASEETERIKNEIVNSVSLEGIKRKAINGEGNWSWVKNKPISEKDALEMDIDKTLDKGEYTVIVGRLGNEPVYFATKTNATNPAISRAIKIKSEKDALRKKEEEKLQQDSLITQGNGIYNKTTTTYERWRKNNKKNFDAWYYGSTGG